MLLVTIEDEEDSGDATQLKHFARLCDSFLMTGEGILTPILEFSWCSHMYSQIEMV